MKRGQRCCYALYASWTKQLGKQRDNVYEVIFDDFACTFNQCIRYNAFLIGIAFGTGPTNEKLDLQTANRSGHLFFIFKAMENIMGLSDVLVNIPQYASKVVYGLAKRQFHVEPYANNDSHHFDKINYFHPATIAKTLRTNLYKYLSSSMETILKLMFLHYVVRTKHLML